MIPYGHQSINDKDIEAVVMALRGDFLTTGPLVEKFEYQLEKLIGAPCAVVSSGTAALHCAYAAIGLEAGDEIISPPITFIATQATAALLGAKNIFVDIETDTGNIDPRAVEAAITSKTRAIVAVDYGGHPADLDELRVIADKYGIFLIEDASHSIGSTYKDRPIGSVADITTFSFFPTKNMTTAEGGAIASIHPELLLKARRFSRQGLIRNRKEFIIKTEGDWHQEVHTFGLNYRLPDVLCALGISQLDRLMEFKRRRNEIFETYSRELSGKPELTLPGLRKYVSPMWHLYHLHIDPESRTHLFKHLRQKEILVQVNYLPVYSHPVFSSQRDLSGQYPVSEQFYKSEISLPIFHGLSNEQIFEVINEITNFLTGF